MEPIQIKHRGEDFFLTMFKIYKTDLKKLASDILYAIFYKTNLWYIFVYCNPLISRIYLFYSIYLTQCMQVGKFVSALKRFKSLHYFGSIIYYFKIGKIFLKMYCFYFKKFTWDNTIFIHILSNTYYASGYSLLIAYLKQELSDVQENISMK